MSFLGSIPQSPSLNNLSGSNATNSSSHIFATGNCNYVTNVYNKGFGSFLKTREFSDLKLVAPEFNREYNVHKLILSYASEYFEKKLDSLSETDNVMTLDGPFAKDFELALRYHISQIQSDYQIHVRWIRRILYGQCPSTIGNSRLLHHQRTQKIRK